MDPIVTDTDILNVVTGLHVTDKVNADESIKIFEGTSETLQSKWRNPVDQVMILVESMNSAR